MRLTSCPKQYTADLDKALPPAETIQKVRKALSRFGTDILKETRRIDTGRLGIPVYLSLCGPRAAGIMPTRKQMGKGASPEQAEASALMELVERFSLFAYFDRIRAGETMTWSQAEQRYGSELLPLTEILNSTREELAPAQAREILDLKRWQFCPALAIGEGRERQIPLDWFKILNEFNGSSAGNSLEESILQGGCELVERHVCAEIERTRPVLPSIDPETFQDPTLQRLHRCFVQNAINLLIKDFSLNTGLPTVGVLAHDPSTFPDSSEIVFTAGTATTPEKAAIRALTEVAQLAGDFETGSRYEPSGLGKFEDLRECEWLRAGPLVPVHSLPEIGHPDLRRELETLDHRCRGRGFSLYSVDTTHPELGIPANYNLVPGFCFRERTPSASLGLFTGRILAEQASFPEASSGFELLDRIYSGNHFTPFFRGLLELRLDRPENALSLFAQAETLQPTSDEQALVAFYQGYTLGQMHHWAAARPHLDRAVRLSPHAHAYHNLRGVASFKLKDYARAALDFQRALDIDKGSAVDLANLGLCHKHLGEKLKAIELLHAGLELDPGLDFARKELADLLQ